MVEVGVEGCREGMIRGHVPPYLGFIWDPISYQVEELGVRQREKLVFPTTCLRVLERGTDGYFHWTP